MPNRAKDTAERDGFVIRNSSAKEVHFIPCTYAGSQREQVERGLRRKTRDDLIVFDTRWEQK